MIKIENIETIGWEHAVRGMRNPRNSWDRSDSYYTTDCDKCKITDESSFFKLKEHDCYEFKTYQIGKHDYELMMKLAEAGSVHSKFRRMITVYMDITAPLYWWKEFDTHKVGTVANSCSSIHHIYKKEFALGDFSCEHLRVSARNHLCETIDILNAERKEFIGEGYEPCHKGDKEFWWQIIQLLPSSYNQKRTVMLNYEVLSGIYKYRKDHKLDEWREFCKWIEKLPYSEIITCNADKEE